MSYHKIFELDDEYRNIVNEFKQARHEFERKVNYGTYKKDYLMEIANGIYINLANSIQKYRKKRIDETTEIIKSLENKKKNVGYAERPNEAKEFEMRYKLADNRELENMVNDLNSDDLLEINLLRMELKNRGLDELDRRVKNYIIRHDIDGMDEIDKKEYEYRQNLLRVYRTLSADFMVLDGETVSLQKLANEMFKMAIEAEAS